MVAFTAAQIPEISNRSYPSELAGTLYDEDIPIIPEVELEEFVEEEEVDEVFFSYSDVRHEYVMHKASQVLSSGASFALLGPRQTMLHTDVPVVSVGAVRTGAGKSPTSRWLVSRLSQRGLDVVVIRHPMPYGDLNKQRVQEFRSMEDLDRHDCTIEEREDYEPHLKMGATVYAGVDYEAILKEAETEAEVILWEGGNNDFPFIDPDVNLVLVDPHRPGHETTYYPGEANLRMADIVLISKVGTARAGDVETVKDNVRSSNPDAEVIEVDLAFRPSQDLEIQDRRVLAVEDGPTVTHGEMPYGAATIYARQEGAEMVDPREWASGSLKEVYKSYPHLSEVLPAVGYSSGQMRDLENTINSVECEYVLLGTPTDISRYLRIDKPVIHVTYSMQERRKGELADAFFSRMPSMGVK